MKKISNIFLTSLAPVLGFVLSTLSIKGIRRIWKVVFVREQKR